MLRIGLTGPSGSGKGVVCALCAQFGVPSVDTDAVYHELLLPPSRCLDELVAAFGHNILAEDGTLNRSALASMVFDPVHSERLTQLNAITHRHILERVRELCARYESEGYAAVLIDAPVLFESGFDCECDRTLAVLADPEIRLKRIIQRDGLTEDAARARMQAQPTDDFYISRADAILYNDQMPQALISAAQSLLRQWGVTV